MLAKRTMLLAVGLLSAACNMDRNLYRQAPFGADQIGILAVLDEVGRPIGERPAILRPGQPFSIDLKGDAFELVIVAFDKDARAPNKMPLLECDILYEGEGAQLTARKGVWRTGLITGEDEALFDLTPRDVNETLGFSLVFDVACARVADCDGVLTEVVAAPGLTELRRVVSFSDHESYAVGRGSGNPMSLAHIVDNDVLPLSSQPSLLGVPIGLARVGADRVYGVSSGAAVLNTVFAFDLQGMPQAVPPLSINDPVIAGAADGTVYVAGDTGLWQLSSGSTVASYVPGFEVGIDTIVAVRRDRVAAYEHSGSIRFFDGDSWSIEFQRDPTALFAAIAMAGDEEHLYLADGQSVLIRDESRAWSVLPVPNEVSGGGTVNGIAALSDGRFVVTFEGGGLGVYLGDAWCNRDRGLRFYGVSASVGGHEAIAVGPPRDMITGPMVRRLRFKPEP